MRRSHTAPRLVEAHQTAIRIVQRPRLLNETVSLFVQLCFTKLRGYLDYHIGIDGERIGVCRIPAERFTEVHCILEGLGTVHTEVRPRVLVVLCRNGKGGEIGIEYFQGVIGGARIRYTDGIGDFERGHDGAHNNAELILHH